ncbi:HAMP domain-containing sensor histidine kinase [Umezawaea sp. Da 62-37]|uniref:sensor histidine kinase n=1 Tax=Umezawaea sp. Da 62-37 TaxID=3075927 RepID=UPI0028F73F0B|nr:HAMP domain-containing sensor histidine kinase [Umezawaea sp. Da 62-37]WNV84651.1 HAMP domain-containing sensor histidine kinase [Umezawaea sp. Da 62-37]
MDELRRPALRARVRFTALYAALFLGSGIGLLALTLLLAGGQSTQAVPGQPDPAGSREIIAGLREQLAGAEEARSRQLLVAAALALLVMAVVSVVMGKAVAGRVLRPLRTITAATRRITADSLHERLAAPGPDDEVKHLADTIDGLLERLETSFAAQRRFIANTSHELRTPLATMRASLDVAVAKPEPSSQAVALADRMRTELDRVDELLEGLLVLARAQHGVLADRVEVSLADLAADALAIRADAIATKGLVLDTAFTGTARTVGSPALLARMVENVIDNAVVHNGNGGWIRVTAGIEPRLVVETGGPVLDPDHVARLAQPFQRLAADRTGFDTGTGLGLSIVAAIAGAHGGRLDLHARPEGGLRVTLVLP